MVAQKGQLMVVTSFPESSGVTALKNASDKLGIQLTVLHSRDSQAIARISDAEHIIYRLGPQTFNAYKQLLNGLPQGKPRDILEAVILSFDKVEIAQTFKRALVPHPVSWVVKKGDAPTSFPVIIKIRHGNKGVGVGLLNNPNDYLKFVAEFPNESKYLLQEYIASAVAQDKRLIIVGNRLVAAMRRTSAANDFRANLHAGGSAEVYVPTAEEVELAIKAIKAFNLQYAGVDIIDSPKGPLVLEVNPSPGFAISKITGTDVAQEVIIGVMND